MTPSIKTLSTFGADKAKVLRQIMTGEIDVESFAKVRQWLSQCYNRPSDAELQMCAIDEVLDGFGVEAIEGAYVDRYHFNIQITYVNMGDTYDTTVIYDNVKEVFAVSSWGDYVEYLERQNRM